MLMCCGDFRAKKKANVDISGAANQNTPATSEIVDIDKPDILCDNEGALLENPEVPDCRLVEPVRVGPRPLRPGPEAEGRVQIEETQRTDPTRQVVPEWPAGDGQDQGKAGMVTIQF